MDFKEFIKKERLSRGFTLKDLAEKAGISATYLGQIESGTRNPPSEPKLKRLAEALDIPLSIMLVISEGESFAEDYLQEALDYNKLYKHIRDIRATINSILTNQPEPSERYNFVMINSKIEIIIDQLENLSKSRKPDIYPLPVENLIADMLTIGSHGQGYIKRQVEVYREFWKDVAEGKAADCSVEYSTQTKWRDD